MSINKIWFISKTTFLAAILLSGISCTNATNVSDSEAGNPSIITESALINMPTSVASGYTITRGTAESEAEELYSCILDQNNFVNELINGDDFSAKTVFQDVVKGLPWGEIKAIGQYDTVKGTESFSVKYDSTESLPYSFSFSDSKVGEEWKCSGAFNGDTTNWKGRLYFFTDVPDNYANAPYKNEETDSLAIRIDFEKKSDGRYLDLKITQVLDEAKFSDTSDIADSFDYSLYENNGILHISSGSHHPFLKSLTTPSASLCYIYKTVADTAKNIAKVHLSIAPDTYNGNNDDTLYEIFGAAAIYSDVALNIFKDSISDTIQAFIVTSYKEGVSLDSITKNPALLFEHLDAATEIESMTHNDLITFLELNKDLDDGSYNDLLWLTQLTQPVYFDLNGYADNGSDTTTIDTKFSSLFGIECNRENKNPALLKELVVTEK